MPHRETDIFDIGIEELITKSITEGVNNSLKNYLEKIFTLEDSLELKAQVIQDMLIVWDKIQKKTKAIDKLGEPNLQSILELFEILELNLFDRYGEFFEKDPREEFKIAKQNIITIFNGIEGFQVINNSQKEKDTLVFLSQFSQGLDMIVDVIETNFNLFPLSTHSALRLYFNQLPNLVQNKIQELGTDEQIEAEVKRYTKAINRTILSGIWHLDFWSNRPPESSAETEESLKEKQIGLNQLALNMVQFWLQEDERIDLTPEMEEDNKELMEIIDEHRERKLFSDYYT